MGKSEGRHQKTTFFFKKVVRLSLAHYVQAE